jgi:hypothetical protein
VGVDPSSLHRAGAVSPLQFLRSLVGPDGHVHYSRTSDQTPVWVTAEAMMALARKPLPLAPVRSAGHHHGKAAAKAAAARAQAAAAARRRRAAALRQARKRAAAASRPTSVTALAADAATISAVVLAPVGLGPA